MDCSRRGDHEKEATVRDWKNAIAIGLTVLGFSLGFAFPGAVTAQTGGEEKAAAEVKHECTEKTMVTQEELSASVPALKDLHEVVYPLWHTAYSQKDCDMIKKLLPDLDAQTAKLDEAKLPGILRDKQAAWDEGKKNLKFALQQLHSAAEANNPEDMLKQTEAFHSAYEKLVRTIRPMVPELDAFHQELYKLYHYYAPQYDLAQIRASVQAMQEKLPALKKATLPERLVDRQKDFDAAVVQLEASVAELAKITEADAKKEILAGVEKVHSAYQQAERVFD
jgi:triphosphoribosyl-dephospho-CoA synthetase